MKDNKEPPFGAQHGMTEEQLKALKEFIEENLRKGFIQASSSPAGAPVLFVTKLDASPQLCVDYRGFNEITIDNDTHYHSSGKPSTAYQKQNGILSWTFDGDTTKSEWQKERNGKPHLGHDTDSLSIL
jgi:hypothetical protein